MIVRYLALRSQVCGIRSMWSKGPSEEIFLGTRKSRGKLDRIEIVCVRVILSGLFSSVEKSDRMHNTHARKCHPVRNPILPVLRLWDFETLGVRSVGTKLILLCWHLLQVLLLNSFCCICSRWPCRQRSIYLSYWEVRGRSSLLRGRVITQSSYLPHIAPRKAVSATTGLHFSRTKY